MAFAHDQRAPRRQCRPPGQRLRQVVGNEHVSQPSLQQCAQLRIGNSQQRDQRGQSRRRRGGSCRNRQLVERKPGRRRIGSKSTRPIEIAHFKTRHPFNEDGLKCGFPSRLDVHPLPEAGEARQFVTSEPGLKCALLLDILLQSHQRGKARIKARQCIGLDTGRFKGLRATLVGVRQLFFQACKHGVRLFEQFLGGGLVAGKLLQQFEFRGLDTLELLGQALPSQFKRLQLPVRIALALCNKRETLLDLGQGHPHFFA